MNALARKSSLRVVETDETGAEAAYRRTIGIHCPNIDEMEMAVRVDLAGIRDLAVKGMHRAGPSAAAVLGEVMRIATTAVYAPLPTSQLIRIRAALNFTIEAARALERVAPDGR